MSAVTRFVLRHKLLVVCFWVVLAGLGAATVGSTTHRLTNGFAMPGPAFQVDNRIAALYGNGGDQDPVRPRAHRAARGARHRPRGRCRDRTRSSRSARRAVAARADRRLRRPRGTGRS